MCLILPLLLDPWNLSPTLCFGPIADDDTSGKSFLQVRNHQMWPQQCIRNLENVQKKHFKGRYVTRYNGRQKSLGLTCPRSHVTHFQSHCNSPSFSPKQCRSPLSMCQGTGSFYPCINVSVARMRG